MSRKAKRRKHHQDAKRRRAARRGAPKHGAPKHGAPQKVALRNGAPQKGLARNVTTRNGGAPRHSPNGERREQLSIVDSPAPHLFRAAGLAPSRIPASSFAVDRFPVAPQVPNNRILDLSGESVDCDELVGYAPDLRDGGYRGIHFGERLNYSRNPLLVLRRARQWLAPGGAITATFANARHVAVATSLLAGEWRPDSQRLTPNAQRLAPTIGHGHFPPSPDPLLPSSCPPPPSSFIPHPSSFASVRFYTRREIEKLFYRAGYVLRELRAERNPAHQRWSRESTSGEIVAGSLRISTQSPEEADEFLTERYRAVAVREERRGDAQMGGRGESTPRSALPVPRSDLGLTSIVIVTFNQLAYTRMCLESIRFRTDEPYELIVVDNGSTDGTLEYLRSAVDVRLIVNAGNRGFPAAANQGILASRGQQILLLNNDVVVTTGWLRRMLDALGDAGSEDAGRGDAGKGDTEADAYHRVSASPLSASASIASVGLVGPCSNAVSGPQQVPVSYDDLASLDGFAWDWGRRHDTQRDEVERLVGFCLLFRRELIEKVGILDERFGIGNFEDDDFCLRARQAGYRAIIARDAFIHHFGHRTFARSGVDLNALLLKNEQIFQEKWQGTGHRSQETGVRSQERSDAGTQRRGAPATEITASPRLPISASSALPPSPDPLLPSSCPPPPSSFIPHPSSFSPRPRLSCCMITRNNETTIAAAVTSILPWVDDVIVVDTGSTDRTPEICRQLGCKVYHFPWPDSFSVARNESLKHATGDWIFWMDSDDVIDAENGRLLRELLSGPIPDNILGLTMQVHCPSARPESEHDATVVDHCKVFRNRRDVCFEGRIHEQVLGSIGRAGGNVAFTPLFVVHANADHTPAGRRRKLVRDFKLLRLELKEQPGHTFTLFNLGMTFADSGKHRKAVRALERSLAAANPGDSHVRKIYALLVSSLKELGRAEEASRCCQQALTLFPKDAELLFRWGVLSYEAGRLRLAESAYLAALANDEEPHYASIDRGITGYEARQNLALVYADMGAPHKAEEQWCRIVEELPNYRDGWRGLFDNLLEQGKSAEAQRLAAQLAGSPRHASLGLSLLGRLAEMGGQLFAARTLLEQARRAAPNDSLPLQALTGLLFQYGEPAEAKASLVDLVTLEPADAAAHHNLGTVCLRMAQPGEAAQAFQASLKYRPDSPLTQLCLGYAFRELGRTDEAASTWRACLRLAPEGPLAAEAQRQLQALAA